jgi:hypothetical protein
LEESLVEVGAYLEADAEALELVQPRKGSLYHPTGLAQAGGVPGTASGDLRHDAAGP